MVFRYEAADPRITFAIRDSIKPFLLSAQAGLGHIEADCTLEYEIGAVAASPGEPAYRGAVWELRPLRAGAEEIVFGASGPWARVLMNESFTHGRITQSDQAEEPFVVYPGDYPIAEYLTCRLVGKRGGLHLHASSVLFDGKAYVFLGHSGAGKSTLAGIAEGQGGEVLSDDRTVITFTEGGATAWGTPWHGSLQRTSAGSAPVAGVYLLVQAPADRLSAVPGAAAIKEIFVRLIQPRLKATEVEATLGAIERLLGLLPLQRFEFTASTRAIDYLREHCR